jgi:glucokinase
MTLASVATLCDLDLIAVAGSVALGYGPPFFQAAMEALHDHAKQSYSDKTQVLPAALGSSAPLIGCAAVAWRGIGQLLAGTG